ncbi:hypothetical protein CEXT_268771, partial [Caerostris extrusa]
VTYCSAVNAGSPSAAGPQPQVHRVRPGELQHGRHHKEDDADEGRSGGLHRTRPQLGCFWKARAAAAWNMPTITYVSQPFAFC